MKKEELISEIKRLKKEKRALIVAHYYVEGEVQAVADYVGDSYYLSKICMEREEPIIIFCGVKFMGESAKILNSKKKIIMAELTADCPMAHMIDIEKIEEVRNKYEDLAVVCYINSTAEIKACADVVVTSSNACDIVRKLPQKNIFFIPDEQLGRYIAGKVPQKHFIFHNGFCHVHTAIDIERLKEVMIMHPDAKVLAHPECKDEITRLADYTGSTAGIIDYATKSEQQEFIICTEIGIFYELTRRNPNKQFYSVMPSQLCPNMKRVDLQHVYEALKNEGQGVEVEENIARKAKHALSMMHELGN